MKEKQYKKRLLKDLPFGQLDKGSVLYQVNNSYQISRGETFYSSGGSSDNGAIVLDEKEKSIIDEIWENPDWFEDAILKEIVFVPKVSSIMLAFEPMDIEDVIDLTKGIIKILPHLSDGNYVWKQFSEVNTRIANH
jgi:hypothetical protein